MADVTLAGYTVPSQPNSGITVFDTDYVPEQLHFFPAVSSTTPENPVEQMSTIVAFSSLNVAQIPVRVKTIVDNGVDLRITIDSPVMIDPGTETHSGYAKWFFSTPTVSNTSSEGTIITAITRLLRRISKLSRGTN